MRKKGLVLRKLTDNMPNRIQANIFIFQCLNISIYSGLCSYLQSLFLEWKSLKSKVLFFPGKYHSNPHDGLSLLFSLLLLPLASLYSLFEWSNVRHGRSFWARSRSLLSQWQASCQSAEAGTAIPGHCCRNTLCHSDASKQCHSHLKSFKHWCCL